jgi:hypothetical protein
MGRPTLDPWIPKVVHIYNFPSKSYKIFIISLCPFILTCLGIILHNFRIVAATYNLRKIIKPLAPVLY